MAAGTEYTQTFSFTASGSGLTGLQYFQILAGASPMPSGSVYVIKSLVVSSSSGITGGSGILSIACVTATSNTGTNEFPFVTYADQLTSGDNIPIFLINDQNPGNAFSWQVNANQQYMGVEVNMTAPGTFYVVVSYIVIPSTSAVVSNFGLFTSIAGVGTDTLLNSSNTNTRLLKSLNIINFGANALNSYTVQLIASNGSTVEGYLSDPVTIGVGETAPFNFPFYIYPNSSTQLGVEVISSGSGTAIPFYLSFIEFAVL